MNLIKKQALCVVFHVRIFSETYRWILQEMITEEDVKKISEHQVLFHPETAPSAIYGNANTASSA